jgi:uncharacterized protein (DUF2062 family)
VKACVVIPCYNHAVTVATVVHSALAYGDVIVVDDGSTEQLPDLSGARVIRFEKNLGKGAALRAGFAAAQAAGCTHAITMDADGQHVAEDIAHFLELAERLPEALGVGVRDFVAAGAPKGRRRTNAFSNFWFRVETGLQLTDTQCGFRCYPLALVNRLRIRSERYAFELEALVRAAWSGARLVPVAVQCSYRPEQVRRSHFRPLVDTLRISRLNMKLSFQAWLVPASLRRAWSLGQRRTGRQTLHEFFAEHAHEPGRLALAVGLGLFCGIAPIWGYQMIAAAALAHWWRLNKAIALLASNISIPPFAPFILYAGLALGHWLFTGQMLELDPRAMTMARALEYLWQWFAGSFVLAVAAAVTGTALTYAVARVVRRR